MKYLSRLLFLLFFLCGCSVAQEEVCVADPPVLVAESPLYAAGSSLEILSSGAVRVCPLGERSGKAILPFRQGLLLFSSGEQTTLTYLAGQALLPQQEYALSFSLEPEDCSLGEDSLSFFDPGRNGTVILSENLEEAGFLPAPAGLTGRPLLSPGGRFLYYTTAGAVHVLDVSSGIHRILRKTEDRSLNLRHLLWEEQILWCQTGTESQFLCTETGALLGSYNESLVLSVSGNGFQAASWETNLWSLVYGTGTGSLQALTPRSLGCEYALFSQEEAVITLSFSAGVTTLDHYDLTTGLRTATQMIPCTLPKSAVYQQGFWFLTELEAAGPAILRWDPEKTAVSDETLYTGPHFTAKDPDREGLAHCVRQAEIIGSSYGLDILLWEAAAEAVPDGIALTAEHRTNILSRELELLEERLAKFPAGMIQTTTAHFDSVKLCLVRELEGSPLAGGYTFFQGRTAYILLEAGDTSEEALYHNLYHLMQTHILGRSSGLDRWGENNPQGFQYDEDYAFNATRNSGIYLAQGSRYFIDTFSMSYAKEDQARIFEYAMRPGQEALFESQFLRKKLETLCRAIREAYGLDGEEDLPWEGYLR